MLKKLLIITAILNFYVFVTLPISADTSVSAVVPPKTDNFQFIFSSNDGATTFPKQQTLTYTITYGAKSSAAFSSYTTITAEFTQDTINGTHVLDYVFGSATKAYQNAPPVVDLTTRKITWTIPSLPPGVMDQKVSFQLRTNSDYSGTQPVNFSVKALLGNSFVSFPEQNIYQTLDPNFTPAPQSSSTTPTPAPQAPPSPSPAPYVAPTLAVSDVFFNTISDTKSEISVHTTLPAKISVFYGTSPTNLPKSFATGDFSTFTKALLDDLKPNTTYYTRISAVDTSGNKTTSEIFTFHTAPTPPVVEINKSTAILTSGGNILNTVLQESSAHTNIQTLLPNLAAYEITYAVPPSLKIKNLEAVVRNKHVLGINTYAYAQESNIVRIAMVEKGPGVYYAKLPPLTLPGDYEVYIRVTETTGNLYEQKVSDILISPPLRVLERKTNIPLDDARLYFYFYNTQTKKFEAISSAFGNITNPVFADVNGVVHTVLPKGRYKVNVSTLFHKSLTREFILAANNDYPTIYLEKSPFDAVAFLQYFGNAVFDFGSNISAYVNGLSASLRYFNVLAFLVLAISIFLGFLFFSFRSLIPLTRLPILLYHHLHHTIFQKAVIFGKVISPENMPLSLANVYLVDNNEKILSTATTSRQGIFTLKNPEGMYTHLHIIHEGYEELHTPIAEENNATYILIENPEVKREIRKGLLRSLQTVFGFCFEAILGLSLLLEAAFLSHFGLIKTLPFFILSLANIALWIFYTKRTVKTHLDRRVGTR